MRTTEIQLREILERSERVRVRRGLHKRMTVEGISALVCLVLIVGASLAVPRPACATLQNTEGSYGSLILGISWVSYVIIGLLTFALGICATLLCIHWQQLRQHGSDSR